MQEYNTDKYNHGFIDFYEPYFEKMLDSRNILEIGVYFGGSLQYLRDKFKSAKIYGMDIEDKKIYDSDRIETFVCNQEDRVQLSEFLNKTNNVEFDIIIDDGGHTMRQQQISFGVLFQKLKKGGMYILEDLHTSRFENYGTILPDDDITTLDMLQNFKYTQKLLSNHITEDERKYIRDNTDTVTIWTRNPEYNQSVTSIIKKKMT
jgi:hypothetical protein